MAKKQAINAGTPKILNGLNLMDLVRLQSNDQKETIPPEIKIETTEDDNVVSGINVE